jgi:hypothetical protein
MALLNLNGTFISAIFYTCYLGWNIKVKLLEKFVVGRGS